MSRGIWDSTLVLGFSQQHDLLATVFSVYWSPGGSSMHTFLKIPPFLLGCLTSVSPPLPSCVLSNTYLLKRLKCLHGGMHSATVQKQMNLTFNPSPPQPVPSSSTVILPKPQAV